MKKQYSYLRRYQNLIVMSKKAYTGLEIAVIGMEGRFPGANNIDEFWSNIKNGVESITFLTDEELVAAGVDSELITNPNFVKSAGGVLTGKEYFDASFFGYTPREAELMDPQVRVFHECAWIALENAGYDPGTYNGLIGLYVGASANLYWKALAAKHSIDKGLSLFESLLLFDKDFLATRIAYKFDLKGPAMTVQTACSTSLVAIHLACRALLTGECDMALAGGVSISTQDDLGYIYQNGMINSQDGRCRAFDENSTGTVTGSGLGVVVLKRLKNAIEDGDNINAVIVASAINNDGSRKVGYTAPSIDAQANVIRSAHRIAKVNPESIAYVETHGTGTPLGDQVEIEALKKAFNTERKQFCRIGSVKTNIGHLDTAAGVTGFIKTVLALKNRKIPPSLHYNKTNSRIEFNNSPFIVNTELFNWENNGDVLRAGISSFGVGGTNAHVILEEAPVIEASSTSREQHMLLFSAKTESALRKTIENFLEFLKKNRNVNLADVAYTLQVGRKTHKYRAKLVCSNVSEAIEELSDSTSRKVQRYACIQEHKQIVFMFAGLGSQYANMGIELYEKEVVFRQEMDSCFEIIKKLAGYDLKEIIYTNVSKEKAEAKLRETNIAQLVVFTFEYALARLLMNWGLKPHAMIGYSLGEYVAACISGVFSLEDALYLIIERARLISKLPQGKMLSVPLSIKDIKSFLGYRLSVGIDNGQSCVVSGSVEDINSLEKELKQQKIMCTPVHNSHAIHSVMMESIVKDFESIVRQVKFNGPDIPFISNVTGRWVSIDDIVNPEYWVKHMRCTVLFDAGIKEILKQPNSLLIEIGSGCNLSSLVSRYIDKNSRHHVVNLIRQSQQKVSDILFLLRKLSSLWFYGIELDWKSYYQSERRHRIPLPTYPFEREYYWLKGDSTKACTQLISQKEALKKKSDIKNWFYLPVWEQSVLALNEDFDNFNKSNWIVFTNKTKLCSKIIDSLKKVSNNIIVVKIGHSYEKSNENEYFVNPSNNKNYDSLFEDISAQSEFPTRILHLWNINESNDEITLETLSNSLDKGLYSLINITQTLGRLNITKGIQIQVVTNNMLKVAGEEILCPEKATLLGPVKIINMESFNIGCRCIDIVKPKPGSRQESLLINNLLSEFKINSTGEVVAYRGGSRWIQNYKPIHLNETKKSLKRLKYNGVYLITGGFGGMGFTLAIHLAKTVKAKLILVSRTRFPNRNEWNNWLENHDEQDSISIKIKKMLEMEEIGAKFLVYNADVSNSEEMRRVIELSEAKFGTINGVLHTAGLADYAGIIQRRTKEMTDKILAPKVKGTIIIDQMLRGRKLDFIVLFSSVGNIFYGHKFGQVGYNAANEFLDAYAHYKAVADDTFTVTINWSDWLQVGMGVEAIKRKYSGSNKDINFEIELPDSLYPNEGVEVFYRILQNSLDRVIVSPRDLNLLLAQMKDQLRDVKQSVIKNIEERFYHSKLYNRPELSTDYEGPRNELEQKLVDIWQEGFGIEKIGIHDNFFELGGDSLKGIMFINKYEKLLNEIVHLTIIFQCPTIAELAAYINKHYIEDAEKVDKRKIDKEDTDHYRINSKKIEKARNLASMASFSYEKLKKRNKKTIFILSPPRSGTTLLRVMLAGHKKLFAPPELHLLAANYLNETSLGKVNTSEQACIRVIMELKGCDVKEAKRIYNEFKNNNTSTLEFYGFIQSCLGERILVDKTPGYSYHYEVLKRAEENFEDAMFIHLLRHPYGMINSYEEAKIDLQREESYMREIYNITSSRRELAELEWTICHQNIVKFLQDIPKERQYMLKFEELVTNPQEEIDKICHFLNVEFDNNMLEPYKEKGKRMTDGIYENGIMIGDVKFHKFKRIESKVANTWRHKYKTDFLGKSTLEIAYKFGYQPINKYIPIKVSDEKEHYELSSVQKRLYTIQHMNPDSIAYNMPTILEISGKLDKEKIAKSFVQLIKRHESLRTSFELFNDEPMQKINKSFEFEIKEYNGRGEGIEEIIKDFIMPFNLSSAPLMRVGLIDKGQEQYVLIIDMHHIITDAVSNNILVQDFFKMYIGNQLPPIKLQYKDFSEWQNSKKRKTIIEEAENYWLKRLEGELPLLRISTDFIRPDIQRFEGDVVKFAFGLEETKELKAITLSEGTTLYMLMLAIFNILLSKICNQYDILIGTPIAARSHPDTEDIVGMFVNTLALRNYPMPNKTFIDFLREVKKNTLFDFQHQDYLFEDLVRNLSIKRDTSRNTLFDVMFKLQNTDVEDLSLPGLNIVPYKYEISSSQFDITLKILQEKDRLKGQFEYSSKLFKKDTINRFVAYYKEIVSQIIADINIELKNINVSHRLSEAKPTKNLLEFNFDK